MLCLACLSTSVLAAPPDAFLTSKAKLSLWTTAGIRSGSVHVDTTEGVVTLYGKVPSSAQRELAGKTAGAISGVSSVVKLRLLTAAEIPSNEIRVDTEEGVVTLFGMVPTAAKEAVEAKDADVSRDLTLAYQKREALKGVTATVKNGAVMLTGTVPNAWGRIDALRATRAVAGVRPVDDQLRVGDDARN
jgi:hyperosmotically inducible periplasmic protein